MHETNPRRTILIACCGTHLVQDGLVALQYVLLPIIAQVFGLNYAQVGLLRSISSVAMSVFEVPSGMLAERFGERRLLAVGLACAGAGYIGVALAPGFTLIALFFFVAGTGAAFQHALASAILVNNFSGSARRRALGTYNSAGDAGKLAFTALFSAGLGAGLGWNPVVIVLAAIGLAFALWLLISLRSVAGDSSPASAAGTSSARARWGINRPRQFILLGTTVFLDTLVQTVFLTFLAFVMLARGATESTAALAVVVALAGGMVGKFLCGFLAARYGDRLAFGLIQILTLIGIAALVVLPLDAVLMALPAIGLAVQGSSTITYGAVADFLDADRQSRGYALIYASSAVSSVAGPLLFGMTADRAGLDAAMWGLAAVVCLTLPLGQVLAPSANRAAA